MNRWNRVHLVKDVEEKESTSSFSSSSFLAFNEHSSRGLMTLHINLSIFVAVADGGWCRSLCSCFVSIISNEVRGKKDKRCLGSQIDASRERRQPTDGHTCGHNKCDLSLSSSPFLARLNCTICQASEQVQCCAIMIISSCKWSHPSPSPVPVSIKSIIFASL